MPEYRKAGEAAPEWYSESMRRRVLSARKMQELRFAGEKICFNAQMGVNELKKYVMLGKKEQEYMDTVYERLHLSLRSYHRILKVARTIADLDGCENVEVRQLQEALCYRGVEERYWG